MTPLTSQRGWLFSSLLRGLVLGGVLVAALLLFRGSGHGHARRGRGVGAKGRGGPKGAERHAAPARPEWRFKEYVPSEWESEWSAFVRSSEYTGKFNRHTAVACVKMTTEEPQRKKAREMLQLIKRRMPFVWSDFFDIDGNERDLSVTPHPDGKAPPPTPLESIWTSDTSPHPLLSKMVYSLPDGTQVAAYIEPLVGHLRHPMHCCKSAPWCGDPNNWDSRIGLIDTNYLLFDRRDGALGFETVKGEGEVQGPPKPIEGLYLDLGATLFPDPKQGREGWGSSQVGVERSVERGRRASELGRQE